MKKKMEDFLKECLEKVDDVKIISIAFENGDAITLQKGNNL